MKRSNLLWDCNFGQLWWNFSLKPAYGTQCSLHKRLQTTRRDLDLTKQTPALTHTKPTQLPKM